MKKQQTPVFENLIHPTAESTTLAAMRDDTDVAMQLVSILDAADFASDKHKLVFLAIKNLLNSVEAIDAHTIAGKLFHPSTSTTSGVGVVCVRMYSCAASTVTRTFFPIRTLASAPDWIRR